MNRKSILTIMLLVIFIVGAIFPVTGVKAATTETITFNGALYKALKSDFQSQGINATYNDAQNTLTISEDEISKVTKLNLSNNGISDLSGLEIFGNVTSIDLSANELTDNSNLDVLNVFNLTSLDLSSNQISDVSSIEGISSIKTLNLHNQIFSDVVVINNSIVKEGTIKYDAELPELVRDFGKPIKSEWLIESYTNNETESGTTSDIKFDWSVFNSNSDSVKLIIGTQAGVKYNGLATLKIKVTDMSNKLYNSEINLYYVIINEDQKAVAIKDNNLYKAIKAQLTKGQTINTDLDTAAANLYDYAYDDQQILVISENVLVNKIPSLVLDNKKIEDLAGIEMFVGLEDSLDVSSNYIDTIDSIIDLQNMKDTEEAALQTKFIAKVDVLKEKLTKLNNLKSELKNVVTAYNEAVGRYNSYVDSTDQNKANNELEQLSIIKEKGKRYIQLTGNPVTIFGTSYSTASSLDSLTTVQATHIAEITSTSATGGEIAAAETQVVSKFKDLYETYNDMYKISTVITPELKNMTEDEINSLNLENAKTLLNGQVTKLKNIETSLTSYEKSYLTTNYGLDFSDDTKTPVATYFDNLVEVLEEDNDVTAYKAALRKLRNFDEYAVAQNNTTINNYCTSSVALSDNIIALATRMTLATRDEINTYIVLPRLYSLDLTENLIENIDDISALVELEKLYAGDNEIVSISNVDWAAMSNLNTLDLSFNEISEIKKLENLKNIESLNLSKNLISGKLDFTISDMKKLESLNLSSNQIDDIEYLSSQYEFIAKAKEMSVTEYLNSTDAPNINLKNQTIVIETTIDKSVAVTEIELPLIFRQLEELQWDKTSFGIESIYGNVTSDGKYVRLNTNALGIKTAEVTVYGTGIGTGTACIIKYTLTNSENTNNNSTEDNTGNNTEENQDIVMTINTNTGSSVKAVKTYNDNKYIVVLENTKVSDLLKEISLNTTSYSVLVKENNTTLANSDSLKTNEKVVLSGLENQTQYIIVVKGDVTSDGQVTMGDLIKLNKYRLNKTELSDAEVLAGNVVDTDDAINMSDIIKLNKYRLDKSISL